MSEAKVYISEIEKNVPILGDDTYLIAAGIKAKRGRSFRPIIKASYEAFTREYGVADPLFSKDHYCIEDAMVESKSMMVCRVHNGGTLAAADFASVGGSDATVQSSTGLAENEDGITAPVFTGKDFAFSVACLGAGVYGNTISISITHSLIDSNIFTLKVFVDAVEKESYEVTRTLKLDAAGSQMYFVERINDISEYIVVFDNALVNANIRPVEQSAAFSLGGGIDDGGSTQASGDLDAVILITAVAGYAGNMIVNLIAGGTAGSEVVSYNNGVMSVSIEDTVSTQTQIASAIAGHALIATAVADSGATAWTLGAGTDTVVVTGGADAGISDVDYIKALPILFESTSLGLPKIDLYMDNGVATQTYTEAILAYARQYRSFGIVSMPEATERATDVANLISYRTTITTAGLPGSYGAIYTSWQKRQDNANRIDVMVPFVGKVAAVFTKSFIANGVPAGSDIGNFTSNQPNRKFNSTERSALYDADINSYKRFPTEGYLVWGQKTLHGDNNSAFSRINTRLVFNDIEDALEERMNKFTFKYVNQENLDQFADAARSYLRTVLDDGRIYAFEVIAKIGVNNTPQTIANREFIVDVYIQESVAAEKMKINMIRTDFGTSFIEG